MKTFRDLLRDWFRKDDGKLICPACNRRLVPLPVRDGDVVEGEVEHLDPYYIHFSCYCGYVFARQLYSEFEARVDACPDIFHCHALNYPNKDLSGAILPVMK